jgi:ATP-dependent DNA helicase PIF1
MEKFLIKKTPLTETKQIRLLPSFQVEEPMLDRLCEEQKIAARKFCKRENLFISGPGGTGKSYWIKTMLRILQKNNVYMPVCALTGCAAILLGNAKTVHSTFGLGQMKGKKEEIIKKAINNRRVVKRLKKITGIIIDEVSMMSCYMIEIIEEIMRGIKKNSDLWGGIQVIFLGDFYQLPPVCTNNNLPESQFCFESPIWKETFTTRNHILFTTMHRQKDPVYQKILNEVRVGNLSEESIEILSQRQQQELPIDAMTRLYPKNHIVSRVNQTKYNQLETEETSFTIQPVSNLTNYVETGKEIPFRELFEYQKASKYDIENETNRLIRDAPAESLLELKIGAPVMCTMNIDLENGICNGSQGKVIEFRNTPELGKLPVVRFNNGKTIEMKPYCWQSCENPTLGVKQIPLRLCWAMSIHKSQGSSMDMVAMDLGGEIFEYGQSYVALSRVRTLEGVYLQGLKPERICANPKVLEFYDNIVK